MTKQQQALTYKQLVQRGLATDEPVTRARIATQGTHIALVLDEAVMMADVELRRSHAAMFLYWHTYANSLRLAIDVLRAAYKRTPAATKAA